MFFQDAPAAFDGVVLAVVWRIVNQHDFKIVSVGKFNHPFHELRPKTGILRTVVEINDQLTNVSETVLVCIPPLLETVGDEVTRFPRRSEDDCQ